MFNVLIVDDKRSIREGLMKHVEWHRLGFNVIGSAPSAAEAVKIIESECVDVLLTDIVMPEVDGLQLIEEVKLINPAIKVIILSAYEKFEYVQKAMHLGTLYYLTKPVDIKKLEAEFTNVKMLLEKEKLERYQKKEIKTLATEQFLNNLVNNYYSTIETISKRAAEINFPCIEGNFLIMRVVPEKTASPSKKLDEGSFQLLKSMVAMQIKEYLDSLGNAFIFNSNFNEISVLFFPYGTDSLKARMEQLKEDIVTNFNIDIFIGVGKSYSSIIHASDSFAEAGKALEYRIIKKSSNVLFYREISEFFKGKSLITPEVEEIILNHLSSHREEALREYVLDIFLNAFKVGKHNANVLYDTCIEILLIINRFLTMNAGDKKPQEHDDYYSIKKLLQKNNMDEIEEFMSGYLNDCFSIIRKNDVESSGIVIENAKKYINEHYFEEITLNKLSEIVYVNPVYLSRLFKEKMGENFIDYLTKIRIERAKTLLADLSLRIYDINEMVGYESRKHFGKTFKDITGMSPKEYRNKITFLQ